MLVDEVTVTFKAGNGGAGKVSFGKMRKSGPDGGNGGKGGNVYIKGSSDLTLLSQFHGENIVEADNGSPGDKQKMFGKYAQDLIVFMPVGSHLKDLQTGEEFELTEIGQSILLCKGGSPGIGNWEQRSPRNTTPTKAIPAGVGQTRKLKITLKFIADFGLTGLPSSGKSSLLVELTGAKAKIGAYHFTTLSPNLGVLPNKKIIADIPGIVEGASGGRGLGINFLKHLEKVKLILHCISVESGDPNRDYNIVRSELNNYSKEIFRKEEIIVITKTDLVDDQTQNIIMDEFKKFKKMIIPVSIYNPSSIESLIRLLR